MQEMPFDEETGGNDDGGQNDVVADENDMERDMTVHGGHELSVNGGHDNAMHADNEEVDNQEQGPRRVVTFRSDTNLGEEEDNTTTTSTQDHQNESRSNSLWMHYLNLRQQQQQESDASKKVPLPRTRPTMRRSSLSMRMKSFYSAEDESGTRRVTSFRSLDYDNFQRPTDLTRAMRTKDRLYKTFLQIFCCKRNAALLHQGHGQNDPDANQFYVPPPNVESMSLLTGLRSMARMKFLDFHIWKLRAPYLSFFTATCVAYFWHINMFALCILATVMAYHRLVEGSPECVGGWWYTIETTEDLAKDFEIAFALSWTTFSTVGYGTVSPSIQEECPFLRYLCACEACFGLIFFSLSSAVFYSKITRLLSKAQITFSRPLCVRYGSTATDEMTPACSQQGSSTGVSGSGSWSDSTSSSLQDSQRPQCMMPNPPIHEEQSRATPSQNFPVMEFKVVNHRANQKGWAVHDCSVSAVVAINIPVLGTQDRYNTTCSDHNILFAYGDDPDASAPSGSVRSALKRTFHTLQLVQDKHPYFQRVWFLHHVLDEDSPLLTNAAKEEIRRRGGVWPSEWNHARMIRTVLVKFNTISVTFNGISSVTASKVFLDKKYKYEDVYVGWRYADLLYLDKTTSDDKRVMVDTKLIHDILPQAGSDCEPMHKRGTSLKSH